MNILGRFGRAVRAFTAAEGYDGTETRNRRRAVAAKALSEDDVLDEQKRRILQGNAADLARNFAVAAWAIRKHLDYVTTFTFAATTEDKGFNGELERFVEEISKPQRFDYAGRHDRRRAVRLSEQCAIRDGDVLWYKRLPQQRRKRGTCKCIESDLIGLPNRASLPRDLDPEDFTNGLKIDPKTGETRGYALRTRKRRRKPSQFVGVLPARDCLFHALYDRFDQVRGISPIAAALNWYRDCYEGFEYALAKVKVSQLLGLVTYRDAEITPFGEGTAEPTEDADDDGVKDAKYEVDPGAGTWYLDLDAGDRMETVESKTPAAETIQFLKLMIHVALRSLDIPYSLFDESFTNFYGSKGGLLQYLKSCRTKIGALQQLQNDWLRWRLGVAVFDGELELPRGKEFDFVSGVWIPAGQPWWDTNKEAKGASNMIAGGMTSPQRVCREIGTDFEKNIDETAAAIAYAAAKNITLSFGEGAADEPDFTLDDSETEGSK